jgi:hypothetical protein
MEQNAMASVAAKACGVKSGGDRGTTRTRRSSKQCELAFRSWGGARRGAGRKPKGERALVPHDTRPLHKARFPLLITTRLRPGLPSLRRAGEAEWIRLCMARANSGGRSNASAKTTAGAPRFQVVHHSIQSNHLHLIVEAADRTSLTAGVRGLLVRIARALNRLWRRSGSVFGDRFHERELKSPREVRNALVYVLQNLRKHGIRMQGPDPFSSGPQFAGWASSHATDRGVLPRSDRALPSDGGGWSDLPTPRTLSRAARLEVPSPTTWLLGSGWQRHGLIHPGEGPIAR